MRRKRAYFLFLLFIDQLYLGTSQEQEEAVGLKFEPISKNEVLVSYGATVEFQNENFKDFNEVRVCDSKSTCYGKASW